LLELFCYSIPQDIRFVWVPGHNNIIRNEIVDEMAKKATKEPIKLWNLITFLNIELININPSQICQ
jgi:ribonuclease HI